MKNLEIDTKHNGTHSQRHSIGCFSSLETAQCKSHTFSNLYIFCLFICLYSRCIFIPNSLLLLAFFPLALQLLLLVHCCHCHVHWYCCCFYGVCVRTPTRVCVCVWCFFYCSLFCWYLILRVLVTFHLPIRIEAQQQ